MRVTTLDVRATVRELDTIIAEYKLNMGDHHRDWRTYEQQVAARLQTAFAELKPLVAQAVRRLQAYSLSAQGAPPKLSLEQKMMLALLKRLFEKSNRDMAFMTVLFSALTDVSVSYKTIERIYSNRRVHLVAHNLHRLLLEKKGIQEIDATGDGTGYSLTVTKHYGTEAQKLKEGAKSAHKSFIYSFELMDIHTRFYVGYGTSFRSEQEAFREGMQMAKESGIIIKSLRLDRYYSAQIYVEYFKTTFNIDQIFLIPKTNATIKGPWNWKRMLAAFVDEPMEYLNQYFQRNQSESGIAEDKKRTGWRITQQRPERVDFANALTHLWHNIYWLGAE